MSVRVRPGEYTGPTIDDLRLESQKGFADAYEDAGVGIRRTFHRDTHPAYLDGYAEGQRARIPGVSAGRKVPGLRYVARVTMRDGSEVALRPRRTYREAWDSARALGDTWIGCTVGTVAWETHA